MKYIKYMKYIIYLQYKLKKLIHQAFNSFTVIIIYVK